MPKKPHKDDSFVDYLLDAMSALPGLRAKFMFGGFGLQSEDAFFGIVIDGAAYFKVDDVTRQKYVEQGSEPFVYSRDGKQMTMGYYMVPANVVEEHEQLLAWAEEAIGVARKARTTRVAKPERKLARKGAEKKSALDLRDMKITFVDLEKRGFATEPRYYFYGWSDSPRVLGRKSLAAALLKAKAFLPKGHNFKIWDCQRDRKIQLRMIAAFRRRLIAAHPKWNKERLEKEIYTFASRPKLHITRLDHHRTGGAVDLTIIDRQGRELWMGTDHDDLTPVAAMDYYETARALRPMDKEARKNRRLLKKVMLKAGFYSYAPEWWHFGFER